MRYISAGKLKQGMTAAKAVYSSAGMTIVREGDVFDGEMIAKVVSSGISSVLIEDKRVQDVRIEELIAPNMKFELYGMIKDIYENLEITRSLWENLPEKDRLSNIKEIVNAKAMMAVLEKIVAELDVITDMQNVYFDKEMILVESSDLREYLTLHALNVTILSIALGKIMKFPRTILVLIAQAAVFHDLGIIFVPKDILMKDGKLSADEYERVKVHVELTFKILYASKGAIHPHVMTAIQQHHENVGGTGYPGRLKENQIHVFAKIIAICNVYAALVAKRPWREAFMPHSAIEYVLAGAGDLFDYNLVKSFTHLIPAYPKGIMVELNTGEKGCVVNANKGVVARPKVRVFYDSTGTEPAELTEYDLAGPEHQTKMITKILDE